MYTTHCKPVLLAGVAALAIATGPASAATSQELLDARQESQIWTTMALSPYLNTNELKVSVRNGKATLSGQVADDISKDLAQQIALGVKGVKDVDNQIVVKEDYVPANRSGERSYNSVIKDATITTAVKSKLLWSRYADGLSTKVETQNGKVTLTGTADSAEAKELAGRLAMNTKDVSAVDNQLTVSATPSTGDKVKTSAKEVKQEISDSWITTKAKSSFLYSGRIDGSGIKVSTKNGVVSLSGKVGSDAERNLAVDLVKSLRGVKSVDVSGLTVGSS